MELDIESAPAFPVAAGILLGVGMGGFFDGIVMHQILQWHHMLSSAGYPPDELDRLRFNVLWDGLFHAVTYLFVIAGLALLWRHARRKHADWPGRLLVGSILMGFGFFNLVEGITNHHLLQLHHLNETVPAEDWLYWDLAFLAWGMAMVVVGWLFLNAGQRSSLLPHPGRNSEPIVVRPAPANGRSTRPVDNGLASTKLSTSGAVLGRPDRLHGAYGMVVGKTQGKTPSPEERAIRGLDPETPPA